MSKGQPELVEKILKARGYAVAAGDHPGPSFEQWAGNLSRVYPLLATDRQFCELVLGMSTDMKRELRRLARSDGIQVVDPVMASQSTRSSTTIDFEQTAAVLPGTTVLWIDDEPKREDQRLLPAGVNLVVAKSTDEALRMLEGRREPVALIISDIGRGADRDAGLEGLRLIRQRGLHDGPAVLYTLRPTSRQVDEASGMNAVVTSSPDELRSTVERYLPVSPPSAPSSSSAYSSAS